MCKREKHHEVPHKGDLRKPKSDEEPVPRNSQVISTKALEGIRVSPWPPSSQNPKGSAAPPS